jgi:hypothetical protein
MELGGDNDEGYESEGGEDIWVNIYQKNHLIKLAYYY